MMAASKKLVYEGYKSSVAAQFQIEGGSMHRALTTSAVRGAPSPEDFSLRAIRRITRQIPAVSISFTVYLTSESK
jgi:hypothetical protein